MTDAPHAALAKLTEEYLASRRGQKLDAWDVSTLRIFSEWLAARGVHVV